MFFPRGDEHNKRFMGELADVLRQQHAIQRRNIDIQKNGVDAVMLQKLEAAWQQQQTSSTPAATEY